MSGKSDSRNGKKVSEDTMSTVALQRACEWHDDLMDAEFQGRKDKESAARFRLSKKTGVPESYLFRLAHKRKTMRDLSAEVYRLLDAAHAKYIRVCEATEAAADRMEVRRLERNGNAVVQSRPTAVEGTVAGHLAAPEMKGEE